VFFHGRFDRGFPDNRSVSGRGCIAERAAAAAAGSLIRPILTGQILAEKGLAVTIGSYYYAEEGDRFVLAYGAVLGGGFQFLHGMIQTVRG